jgi:hypothetical protein
MKQIRSPNYVECSTVEFPPSHLTKSVERSMNTNQNNVENDRFLGFHALADEYYSFLEHYAVKIGICYQCFGGGFCLHIQGSPSHFY